MNLESFTGPGSTPSRRRFWDQVAAAVNASQKVQGDNVSVEEHQGMGTIINVPLTNRRPNPSGTTGACCISGECSILSSDDCTAAGGYYAGNGTACEDDPCAEIGCCYYDLSNQCVTTTSEICAGIPGSSFVAADHFCWPEGNQTGFTVQCCLNGQIPCVSNDGLFYFCCDDPQFCCNEECCEPGQTCVDGLFCDTLSPPP